MNGIPLALVAAILALVIVPANGAGPAGDCSNPVVADGSYVDIDMPGRTSVSPAAINDRGDIVGYSVEDDPEKAIGFLLHHGEFTPLIVPGAFNTSPLDINNAGVVVGFYCVMVPEYGCGPFTWRDGQFTTGPTSSDWEVSLRLRAINNTGTMVGDTGNRAVILRHGRVEPIMPDAEYSSAIDLNERGDLLVFGYRAGEPLGKYLLGTRGALQEVRVCDRLAVLTRVTNQRAVVGWTRFGDSNVSPSVSFLASSRGITVYQYPGSDVPGGSTALHDLNSAGYAVGSAALPQEGCGPWDCERVSRAFMFVPAGR